MPADFDVVIVGAGVVGCAVAERLARAGRSVAVLDRAPKVGSGVTARNSGVIHAGLYDPPGTLRARTCVRGRGLLLAWCARHGVPHRVTGKLVVAHDAAGEAALGALLANGRACGVDGLSMLTARAVRRMEPALAPARAALASAHTGIVDAHALTASLQAAAERHGAWRRHRGRRRPGGEHGLERGEPGGPLGGRDIGRITTHMFMVCSYRQRVKGDARSDGRGQHAPPFGGDLRHTDGDCAGLEHARCGGFGQQRARAAARLAQQVSALGIAPDRCPEIVRGAKDASLLNFQDRRQSPEKGAMVPRRGLEPPRPCGHWHLKPARLPIPPPGHGVRGGPS